MKKYTIQVRIPEQMVEVEVMALARGEARRLIGERFEGLDHEIVAGWVDR